MAADCSFCRVESGDASAHVLARTPATMAFLDGHPAAPGHVLVAPRGHITAPESLSPDRASALFGTVKRVMDALHMALDPAGISMFYTTGTFVGSVEHAHVHVIPRERDDAIAVGLTRDELADEEGRILADRLRSAL